MDNVIISDNSNAIDIDKIELNHAAWLNSHGKNGCQAVLNDMDFSNTDVSGRNFRKAVIHNVSFKGARLKFSSFQEAELVNCDFTGANVERVNFTKAKLQDVKGLINTYDYLNSYFEKTNGGFIAYKVFDLFYPHNKFWQIKENAILRNKLNKDQRLSNTYGIHVGTMEWMKRSIDFNSQIVWKVLIKEEWVKDVIVPYNSNGNIRCKKIKLIEPINENIIRKE